MFLDDLDHKNQDGRQSHIEKQKKWYLLNQMCQKSKWSNFSYKFGITDLGRGRFLSCSETILTFKSPTPYLNAIKNSLKRNGIETWRYIGVLWNIKVENCSLDNR